MTIKGLPDFRKGFKNLKYEERNKIFYYTLFDFSGWEDNVNINNFPSTNEIKDYFRIIFSNKRKFGKFAENFKQHNIDKFLQSNVFTTDDLAKHILATELNCNISEKSFCDIKKDGVNIEMKRLISTVNLDKEVIVDLCDNKLKKDTKSEWILTLIFPITQKEHHSRIRDLITGYHNIEELINFKSKSNIKVLVSEIDSLNLINNKTSLEMLKTKIETTIENLNKKDEK